MYSDNSTYARQSMVFTGQRLFAQHEQNQYLMQAEQQIEAECRYALQLADEYFHGDERRQQAAAVEVERLRIIGESIADAMFNRVDQQRGRPSENPPQAAPRASPGLRRQQRDGR
jgi:hypothetical protein